MKKVIVFGGSGFLGSYVVEELLARNYRVIVADTIKSPHIPEKIFKKVGKIVRKETEELVIGYQFDLKTNEILQTILKNPTRETI